MLFIALGTGIGGALVCGGQLVLGAQGRAGELGYYLDSSDVEKGEINKLGQQGILEKNVLPRHWIKSLVQQKHYLQHIAEEIPQ